MVTLWSASGVSLVTGDDSCGVRLWHSLYMKESPEGTIIAIEQLRANQQFVEVPILCLLP